MAYINRAIEDTLKNRFETAKSVAITGARQVGKTTMTKHIYSDIRRINLKNVVLYNNAKEDPQGFLENFERPLFVDEVQMVPELIGAAKTILDDVSTRSNYLFSSSQKWTLMKGLSESLAGMVSILELGTLSLREILENQNYRIIILAYGGVPVSTGRNDFRVQWLGLLIDRHNYKCQ